MGITLLEICNFKSYRGKHVIGPFKDFSCVIGPNGSGKSNIMDAIIFVLGHRTIEIRGTKLSELINNTEEKDKEIQTYVEITFFHKGITHLFKRRIIGNGSKYYYSGEECSYEVFQGNLKEIGIDVGTKNFFVFQGDVENIATQNPKQITQFIEQVSGSARYIKEYNELLSGKNKAEDDVFAAYAKRKTIAFEKEQYKEQWSEVKEYQEMQDGVDALKRDQQLAKLYYATKEMKKESKLLDESRQRIDDIREEMKPIEAQYTATSMKQASLHKESIALEDELTKLAKSKKKGLPNQFKVEEEIKYISDKIKKAKTILKKAESNRNKQLNEIEQLRTELVESTIKLEQLEKENDIDGGGALTKMDHAQIEEYNRLKLESGKETSSYKIQLDQVIREQKIDIDQQQALKTKLEEFNTMKLKFEEAQDKFTFQKDTEAEHNQDIEKQLIDTEKELNETTSQFQNANARQSELSTQLEAIQYQLSEYKSMKSESQRDRQFNQTVETLKSIYPGVRGKLMDLCEPSQRKYQTALSLTMGKLMDAIVVDKNSTLLECIEYLKNQFLGVATFIALDRISPKPVNQKLRQLGGTAKLLFDCVKIQKGSEEAVLYALGNTVVCDTLPEAKLLAFGADRVKVITIQGIRITKSGLMSGGGLSGIKSKASQWDNKKIEDLKNTRDKITSELSGAIQLNDIFNKRQHLTSAVHELRTAFNLSKSKLVLIQERMKRNETELETNRNAIAKSQPELDQLNIKIELRKKEIERLQSEIRLVEESFFSDFSKKFGVVNIREYEDNRLAKVQDNIQKRLELSESISNIKSRLDYEQGREIDSEIQQLNEEITNNEHLLKEELEQKEQNEEKIKSFNDSYEKLKQDLAEKKDQLEQMNTTIKELRKQIHSFNNQIGEVEKLINRYEFNLNKLRGTYHSILVETRNENIKLPILQYQDKDIKDDDDDDDGGKSDMSEGEKGGNATSGSEGEGKRRTRRGGNNNKSGDEMESEGDDKKQSTKPKKPTKRKVSKRKREIDDDDDDDDEDIFNESDIESSDKPNLLQEIIVDIPQNSTEEDTTKVYEDEATIRFSYVTLRKKVFTDQKTFEEFLKKLTIDIEAKNKEMKKVMPNYKAFEHLKEVSAKLTQVKKELDSARTTAKEINDRFTEVREARKSLFMRAFKRIVKNLTHIYSDLTRELEPPYHRGSAHLSLEDSVHPYSAGVKFTVIPPNKRFQEMEQLSGGEKSVAALAFLFSTHGLKSTPFMILDEIDAAFDSVNVLKLVRYVRQKASKDLQFLVISHKEQFFVHSDLLVGVCREIDSASATYLLSLDEFPESDEAKKALLLKGDDETDQDGKTSASSASSSEGDD